MARIANLVHETSTTTGAGNFTLAGASNGAQSFNSAFSTGGTDRFYYFITNQSAAEWEVGTGHLSAASTLVRDTIIDSSNAGLVVTFSAGTKDITCDLPAHYQNQTINTSLSFILDTDGTPLTALSLDTNGFPVFDLGSVDASGLTVKNSSASTGGPSIDLHHNSASPAASDLTSLVFSGNDSAANVTIYGEIDTVIVDPTNTSEDSKMQFSVVSGGSTIAALTLGTTDVSSSYAHVFDFGAVDGPNLTAQNSNAGVSGPALFLYHNSASPAASDVPGGIHFYGKDSAANLQAYADITCSILDPTSTSEDSDLAFAVQLAGSSLTALTLGTSISGTNNFGHQFDFGSSSLGELGIKKNDAGNNGPGHISFHDSASPAVNDTVAYTEMYGRDSAANVQLYTWIYSVITDPTSTSEDCKLELGIQVAGASTNALILGATDFGGSFSHQFDFGAGAGGQNLTLKSTSAGGGGPTVTFYQNSASPAANDIPGYMEIWGKDSLANDQRYNGIYGIIEDTTSAAEYSKMALSLMANGVYIDGLTLGGSDSFTSSISHILDFGANDSCDLLLQNSSAGAGGPFIIGYQNSASPAANDEPFGLAGYGKNSAAATKLYAYVRIGDIIDATSGSEDAFIDFRTVVAGALAQREVIAAGVYHPSATGGDKGNNSTNFSAQYDDGTLLTCYVWDAAQTGKVDQAYWDQFAMNGEGALVDANIVGAPGSVHLGAQRFAAKLGTAYDPTTLAGQLKHVTDKKHLSPYPNPAKYDEATRPSMGGWIQRGVEMDELLFVYISQQQKLIDNLTARVAALEPAK